MNNTKSFKKTLNTIVHIITHCHLKAYENYFGVIPSKPFISYGRLCSLIISAKSMVEMS